MLHVERDTGQRARIGRDACQENRIPIDRQQLGCIEAESLAGVGSQEARAGSAADRRKSSLP